jgi:hypothetical protein
MELDPIESQIVDYIKDYTVREWDTPGDTHTKWTRTMKRALVELGHKRELKVYVAPKDELNSDCGEWLYDLCWAIERNGWQELSLELVCEIEWNTSSDSILEDFQKLTVGVSRYRLMITEYHEDNIERFDELVNLCRKACPCSAGFRYLMLGIPYDNPEKVIARSWTL